MKLEDAIRSELDPDSDDPITNLTTRHYKPPKEKSKKSILTELVALGTATLIGCITYKLCTEIYSTEYKVFTIPLSIWGTCASSYAWKLIRK